MYRYLSFNIFFYCGFMLVKNSILKWLRRVLCIGLCHHARWQKYESLSSLFLQINANYISIMWPTDLIHSICHLNMSSEIKMINKHLWLCGCVFFPYRLLTIRIVKDSNHISWKMVDNGKFKDKFLDGWFQWK